MSEPNPESSGEIGEIGRATALAIVVGGLILVLVVLGIFVYLTVNSPAIF